MKRNIDVSEEKISALEMYLTQKNTALDDELTKYTEQLYTKTVPQNVRDYIEMTGGKKPVKKPSLLHHVKVHSILRENIL